MRRTFVLAAAGVLLLAGMTAAILLANRQSIAEDNAHNILGIVESSLMNEYHEPAMQDSVHRDFLVIHEKVRTGEADSAALRILVREFYKDYGDGRIDSVEAGKLMKNISLLASR